MSLRFVCCVCCACIAIGSVSRAGDTGTKAIQILEKNCYSCHGQNGSAEGGISYIVDTEKMLAGKKVIAGDPKKSRIFVRLTSKDDPMPPEDESTRPSPEDIEIVRQWIEAGAPAPESPVAPARPMVTLGDVLSAVKAHVNSLQEDDRPYQRYFSLTHLHNLKSVREVDFRLYQAALSKLVNSLSWKPEIVLPLAVDQHETVFAIDLRDLDWDSGSLWQRIVKTYPYALKHNTYPRDESIREAAEDIYRMTGSPVPIVRADWFIATASRPPLYHSLMQIPDTAQELEMSLKVDVEANFRRNRLWRAGFVRSGVSAQNRMVERHSALYGAYWLSYDFKPGKPNANLFRSPLGPKFDGNPFPQHAFDHDGGEIIFHLPNGLQAYMLIDAKGNRIDEGPLDVVRDRTEVSGSTAIVNGLSCMACHSHGMIDFTDTVRSGTAVQGDALRKVEQLYAPADKIQPLVRKDSQRFLAALEEAIGPFVRDADSEEQPDIKSYPEPVGKIAKWYRLQDLGVEEVAAELGLASADAVTAAIRFNPRLSALGLRPLSNGDTIKREAWEEFRGTSIYQNVASEMELGTPVLSIGR